jgi:hypothetical protein
MSAKLVEVFEAALAKMEQAFQSGAHVTVKFLADDWQKINDEFQRAKAGLMPAGTGTAAPATEPAIPVSAPAPAPVEPVATPAAAEPEAPTSTEGEPHEQP